MENGHTDEHDRQGELLNRAIQMSDEQDNQQGGENIALQPTMDHTPSVGTGDAKVSMNGQIDLSGQTLMDRYVIEGLLGEGGFASVYKARDNNLSRDVAIKIIHVSLLANQQDAHSYRERFIREAEMIAGFAHPNIVPVYDVGQFAYGSEMRPYIVMKRLQGRDLGEILDADGALAPERAIELTKQALDGLASVHTKGVVHRDLKPSNLFVESTGSRRASEILYVMDFGIAHQEEVDSRHTAANAYLGTVNYLSPEYIQEKHVSPAMDVYQMGAILCELLTGRILMSGEQLPLLMKIGSGQIGFPEEYIGTAIEPILRKAMHVDHKQRYRDAGEFLDALEQLDASTLPDLSSNGSRSHQPTLSNTVIPTAPETNEQITPAPIPVPKLDPDPTVLIEEEKTNNNLVFALIGLVVLIGGAAIGVAVLLSEPKDPDVADPPPITTDTTQDTQDTKDKDPETPTPEKVALAVASDPAGAQIFADGVLLGVAPLNYERELDGSSFTLEAKLDGYETASLTLDANKGATIPAFALEKLEVKPPPKDPPKGDTVTWSLTSTPSGATITIGKEVVGTTPLEHVVAIDGKRKEITFSMDGYKSETARLKAAKKRKKSAHVDLEKLKVAPPEDPSPPELPQTIPWAIKSTPSGATVKINGKRVGTTPLSTPISLDGKSLAVEVSKEGFETVNKSVTAKENITALIVELDATGPATKSWTITSDPPGAKIVLNGKNLGSAPVTVEVPLDGKTLSISATANGYKPYKHKAKANESLDSKTTLVLEKKPSMGVMH